MQLERMAVIIVRADIGGARPGSSKRGTITLCASSWVCRHGIGRGSSSPRAGIIVGTDTGYRWSRRFRGANPVGGGIRQPGSLPFGARHLVRFRMARVSAA